tara:strand:+ start:1883 stop:2341 length:459 start_codon:yes stop_codon:yes gene_type:complete
MKSLILTCFLVTTFHAFSQSGLSEDNAKTIVNVFFDGFHKGDTTLMRSVMVKNMRMQSVYTSKSEGNKMSLVRDTDFLASVAVNAKANQWKEDILEYRVSIDGNLAHVWTPYMFYIGGELSHCGANSITLVETNDGWKIYYIIDSRRITCQP